MERTLDNISNKLFCANHQKRPWRILGPNYVSFYGSVSLLGSVRLRSNEFTILNLKIVGKIKHLILCCRCHTTNKHFDSFILFHYFLLLFYYSLYNFPPLPSFPHHTPCSHSQKNNWLEI